MHKQRDFSKSSSIEKTIIIHEKNPGSPLRSSCNNETAIICDDICDTGGTLIKCIERLKEYGITEVWCFITHGILSEPAIDRIEKCSILTRMVVIDTIPQHNNKRYCSKLTVLDSSRLFSNVIECLLRGGSISDLFTVIMSPVSKINYEYENIVTPLEI